MSRISRYGWAAMMSLLLSKKGQSRASATDRDVTNK